MIAELTDRAVIAVSGPEARAFLQGLVTNDVQAVAPGRPLYAALLTPQGKILFDFLIVQDQDGLLIDCRREIRVALVRRLSLYKLRAKLEITARDDLGVVVGPEADLADPRHAALPRRMIRPLAEMPPGTADYQSRRLDLGIPEGADFGSDKMFALDAGLDELHAVAFDKGCYVGQELTARMKHRGTARKRLLLIGSADGSPLPANDTPVTADGQEIGLVTSVYGPRGFALIRLDRLAQAGTLAAGNVAITLTKPSWLFT
ncbi:MAG: hypothetical protein WCA81_15310 [Rhizomicrobium sp.]